LGKFEGKIEILNSHNLICRKFAGFCSRQLIQPTPPLLRGRRCVRCAAAERVNSTADVGVTAAQLERVCREAVCRSDV